MPERMQRVTEIAQTATTATYVSGATGVGIGVATKAEAFSAMGWLESNAWFISMGVMLATFVVSLIFKFLEYRLKLQAEKRAQAAEARAKAEFKRRHTDK